MVPPDLIIRWRTLSSREPEPQAQSNTLPGEHEILDLALPSLPEGDHFRDATKMMPNLVTRCFTGLNGTLDGGQKVLPTGVAERFLQIAGEPELHLGRLGVSLDQRVELALHLDDEFLVHKSVASSGDGKSCCISPFLWVLSASSFRACAAISSSTELRHSAIFCCSAGDGVGISTPKKGVFADVQQAIAPRTARDVPLELFAMLVLLKAVLEEAVRVAIFQSEADEDIRCGDLSPSLQKINAALREFERVAFVKTKVSITDQGIELILVA